MMNFASFKKYVAARIDSVVSINVYTTKLPDKKIPDATIYPCLVITFQAIENENLIKEKWIVEINYWSVVNSGSIDSTNVLAALDAVKGSLHGGWQTESEGFFKSYLDTEFEVPDPQPGVYHFYQKYEFTVR